MKLSIIIPCRDANDPKLKELLKSIDNQDFPKDEMETLIITEGTSESAKAIGIRKAKGEVIGILASDNELMGKQALEVMRWDAAYHGAAYPSYYHYKKDDNILNRYFSLFGCNDPLAFYMKKCDRRPYGISDIHDWEFNPKGTTIGDNGFFVRRELIEKTDLDNYYHIDNANEINSKILANGQSFLWHKTGGKIFKFFAKRYRYGLQHAFNKNRRWHLVDFNQPKDIVRLIWFVLCTLTLLQPLWISFKGYRKIQDVAWFLHPVICLLTLFTYSMLVIHLSLNRMFQSLSAPVVVRRA